ncbi:putative zinc-binding metallopeptidase [Sphingobacterium corticis]|uniref:Zinc-binding metallopeptidase n=1 Tax=Sphingobacterium corticis TaxID=1812823 RepID=A0ABW5NHY5_9SPHI
MKFTIKNIMLLALAISVTSSCSDEQLDPNSVFVDSPIELTAMDRYIEREYTKPYNISLLYKYVDMESNMNFTLTPASLENSIRLARIIKYLAIDPYDELMGNKEFIGTYFPKVLNFIGSNAYNNNGTRIIGTAEGGRKITMFNVNSIGGMANNVATIQSEYIHTIHHEFAHIFHQTKPYSPTFNQISAANYIQDQWNVEFPGTAAGLQAALTKGFISQYASKDPDEDFVELIAFYVNLTPAQWEARLASAGTGRAIIEQKFDIVRNYLQVSWNFNITNLRTIVQRNIANFGSFDQLNIN